MILLLKYFSSIVIFGQLFSNVFCVKNILLIVVDDLRPASGCYNDKNAYTPHIDELAANSYVFTRAFAQQALCAPSRNSFLTSRRPDSLLLYDFYSYWRHVVGNFTTLPQFFKERGYVTKSIGKVFHPGISSNNSDDQPYSWSEPPYHPATERYKEWPVCGAGHRNLVCPVYTDLQPGGTLPDLQSVAEAKRFVASRAEARGSASSRPFLLAVGFHKPHVPLKFPKRFLDYHPLENVTLPDNRQRPYGSPTVAWNPWNDLRERDDIAKLKLLFPFQPMPVDWMKRIIQSYNAAVTYIDELVGELLLTLENEGLDNNTIVALIGDHGWSLGEHGEWSKFSNYEVATRVPFILKVPQLQQKGKHLNQEQKDQDLWIQKRKSEQGLHTGQKKLEQQKQEQKDQDLGIQKRKSEEGLLTGQKKLE
ncbi:iduronate 2-sulfatase, partial [Nilaparvata lugens]|uniref:iduronate 2-sulfatase n=1 Tax=Nilaparvata lugens TaxID=108931 RepID=UPI00193E1D9C